MRIKILYVFYDKKVYFIEDLYKKIIYNIAFLLLVTIIYPDFNKNPLQNIWF